MKKHTALKINLIIALAGVLFSGYLSFTELFMTYCPLGECSYILGLPVCVYGLVMYIAVLCVSIAGLRSKD